MFAISPAPSAAGHPLWHLMIVAGGAIAVFIVIKAKEYWDANIEPRRAQHNAQHDVRREAGTDASPARTPAMLALALCSMTSAGIHASVSSEHFREAFIFGAFFVAASATQAGWAVLLLHRPGRTLLIAGAAGNAAIIALWTVTRTVGLPVGPQTWHPEPIAALDVASTLFELALVSVAALLLTRQTRIRHRAPIEERLEHLRKRHPTLVRPTQSP